MRYKVVRPGTTIDKIRAVIEEEEQTMFPIVSVGEKFLGYILKEDVMVDLPAGTTAVDVFKSAIQLGKPRAISVHNDDTLKTALTAMATNCLPFLPVVEPNGRYLGTIDAAAATWPTR